jgi:hypothetical protein
MGAKQSPRSRARGKAAARAKLVVYTALVGDKEELSDPMRQLSEGGGDTDLDLEFVCFTDNAALRSPVWTPRPIDGRRLIPPNRLSRLPKTQPHVMFPDAEYSLYIDNTVAFRRLPNSADLAKDREAVFRAFRHPWRSCPQDEADVVVRSGLDEIDRIIAQSDFYDRSSRPLSDVRTLTAGTVLLRRHNDPRVRHFGELWWEQILLFSARDQLSLDQCAALANCPIDHFPGTKRDNDFILWPALSNPRRVEASFDAERYAWMHRSDPEARARPAAHFLSHAGNGSHADYRRPSRTFAYCCARAGSGLGEHAAPRRLLSPILGPLLEEITTPANLLVAGVASAQAYAAVPEELQAAQKALEMQFRYGPPSQVVTALVRDDDLGEPAPFRAAGGIAGFRLAVVVGLTPRYYRNALAKFAPLLAADGVLVLQFGESLSPAMVAEMQAAAGIPNVLSIYHGGHVSNPGIVASSVFVLRRTA